MNLHSTRLGDIKQLHCESVMALNTIKFSNNTLQARPLTTGLIAPCMCHDNHTPLITFCYNMVSKLNPETSAV